MTFLPLIIKNDKYGIDELKRKALNKKAFKFMKDGNQFPKLIISRPEDEFLIFSLSKHITLRSLSKLHAA